MTTEVAAFSGGATTLNAGNETSSNNCSWLVVSEIFVNNNKTGEETVCLSDMIVYSDTMWAIAGVFCWAAVAVACWNMYRHFDSYAEPKFQVYIVRIIFIIPVYALCSWLSLRFYEAQLYIVTFRDCFEAYIIWCFLRLIMEWMGGPAECVSKLEARQRMRHPWPFGYCCRRIDLNATFIRRCKQGTLQFVILKPFMAVVSIIMLSVDEYDNPVYQWILGVLYNISYTWALYVLFLLYVATKSFLKEYDPVKKFLAVKVVIFMTYYQALAFYVLPLGEAEAEGWSNALLCLEMFVFSLLHVAAFKPPPKAERNGKLEARAAEAGVTSLEMRDIEAQRTLKNLRGVFSMKDLAHDTIHNFDPKYDHYVAQIVDADGNMLTPEVGSGPDTHLEGGEDAGQAEGTDSDGNHSRDGLDDCGRKVSVRSRSSRSFPHRGAEKVPPPATLYTDRKQPRDLRAASPELSRSSIEEQQAMERAWEAQEARLRAELDTEDRVAESSLKQQAMRLPLHKRRKGGYTRSIPTTYAIASDNKTDSDDSDNEFLVDSTRSRRRRSSSSSICDDALPNAPSLHQHRPRAKSKKVRRVPERPHHRRPTRKKEPEPRNLPKHKVPAVAHAAIEHLEAALAAVDLPTSAQVTDVAVSEGVQTDRGIASNMNGEDDEEDLEQDSEARSSSSSSSSSSSVGISKRNVEGSGFDHRKVAPTELLGRGAQVGGQALDGKSELVGLARNRHTHSAGIDRGDQHDDVDDDGDGDDGDDGDDNDEEEYDFDLPESDDQPSSDELDLGLGLAGSADEL